MHGQLVITDVRSDTIVDRLVMSPVQAVRTDDQTVQSDVRTVRTDGRTVTNVDQLALTDDRLVCFEDRTVRSNVRTDWSDDRSVTNDGQLVLFDIQVDIAVGRFVSCRIALARVDVRVGITDVPAATNVVFQTKSLSLLIQLKRRLARGWSARSFVFICGSQRCG